MGMDDGTKWGRKGEIPQVELPQVELGFWKWSVRLTDCCDSRVPGKGPHISLPPPRIAHTSMCMVSGIQLLLTRSFGGYSIVNALKKLVALREVVWSIKTAFIPPGKAKNKRVAI